jgi:hypothetical protein
MQPNRDGEQGRSQSACDVHDGCDDDEGTEKERVRRWDPTHTSRLTSAALTIPGVRSAAPKLRANIVPCTPCETIIKQKLNPISK